MTVPPADLSRVVIAVDPAVSSGETADETGIVVCARDDTKQAYVLADLSGLTTTMPNQQKTIAALKEAGLRDSVKVMIGGAPTTRAWASEIGADGYSEDAIEAVATAKQLMGVA